MQKLPWDIYREILTGNANDDVSWVLIKASDNVPNNYPIDLEICTNIMQLQWRVYTEFHPFSFGTSGDIQGEIIGLGIKNEFFIYEFQKFFNVIRRLLGPLRKNSSLESIEYIFHPFLCT